MVKTSTRTKTPTASEIPEPAKTRTRRSPEEKIAALQAQIAAVKDREARKAAKQTPEGKAFVAARSAVKRARKLAAEADNAAMAQALEDAYGALEGHAEGARLVARQ